MLEETRTNYVICNAVSSTNHRHTVSSGRWRWRWRWRWRTTKRRNTFFFKYSTFGLL